MVFCEHTFDLNLIEKARIKCIFELNFRVILRRNMYLFPALSKSIGNQCSIRKGWSLDITLRYSEIKKGLFNLGVPVGTNMSLCTKLCCVAFIYLNYAKRRCLRSDKEMEPWRFQCGGSHYSHRPQFVYFTFTDEKSERFTHKFVCLQ